MMGLVRFENETYIDSSGLKYTKEETLIKFKDEVLSGTLVRETLSPNSDSRDYAVSDVSVSGQLPSGFNPYSYYASKNHPKGLALTILAASDALMSIGIPWQTISQKIDPSQISVYAGSLMSQLDDNGFGNMMHADLKGKRITSKNLALGLSSMPADFINAYVIKSMGKTGGINGACATFLYNLDRAVQDIREGRSKVAIVGNSEAPLTPEIVGGYAAMGALATDSKLRKSQNRNNIDHRLASSPFGNNCGFVLSESAQYIVLMADDLALDLGADIHGSVGGVFVAADGPKSSISSPGPGNYLTVAKAVYSAKKLLDSESIAERSFVQAHGSSTPQNRTTESKILNSIAIAMGIPKWPVTAIKSYVGHSLSPASADQTISALGIFKYGVLPGINTIDRIADDVESSNLAFSTKDKKQIFDVAFINSKGFGGNNATGYLLSPTKTEELLIEMHGTERVNRSHERRVSTIKTADKYDQQAQKGDLAVIYTLSPKSRGDAEIRVENDKMLIDGQEFSLEEYIDD